MNWTRPDWREKQNYPPDGKAGGGNSIRRQLFAWEFLRRNPEYVADWERSNIDTELSDEVRKRWQLQELLDPSVPWTRANDSKLHFTCSHFACWTADDIAAFGFVPKPINQTEVMFIVDLSLPKSALRQAIIKRIEHEQAEALRIGLLKKIPEAIKADERDWVRYLRLLDARAELGLDKIASIASSKVSRQDAQAEQDLLALFDRGIELDDFRESLTNGLKRADYFCTAGYLALTFEPEGRPGQERRNTSAEKTKIAPRKIVQKSKIVPR